ncbi:MAG: ABC transporter ATP-binding protein [Candidatus Izemoplasmatales bacterium]|nr:ABC transporter ATP-binding protein [Candidatus Izemoplasmatales bacterium]MDD4596160.1 ABC transporter ATP-binding protein [Candidatus Izemoplasmatales bacterium]
MSNPILQMHGICKSYGPGIIAADGVNFSVNSGEIHALAGENGAGKTTLMKILFGMEKPQKGEIFIRGQLATITDANKAMQFGIGMVHQHFMLIDELTVAENVVIGIEPKKHGLFDREAASQLVKEMAEKYNMPVNPEALIRDLNVANKQKVEILKVLARNADIIILDEPTAVLTPQETKRFFEQLSALKKSGRTIIVITHKLPEITAICDRITILRKGRNVGTYDVGSITETEISRLMIGSNPLPDIIPTFGNPGKILLSVRNLSYQGNHGKPALQNVSFDLHAGELLGVIGVEGNGQRELVDILAGRQIGYEGCVLLDDVQLKGKSIKQIRDLGLAFIPEDRMTDGVNLSGSIMENVTSAIQEDYEYQLGPFQNQKKLNDFAHHINDVFEVKYNSLSEEIRFLSGGNMQKVVCAREITACHTVLIANQPTRGVDVGSVRTIHDRIDALRQNGKAILLISSDLSEIRSLCKRAIVLHQGSIVARIEDLSVCSEEELGLYMLGIKCDNDTFGRDAA